MNRNHCFAMILSLLHKTTSLLDVFCEVKLVAKHYTFLPERKITSVLAYVMV